MIAALAALLGCQLLGEILVRALAVPLPGPVAGLGLLFAALMIRGYRQPELEDAVPADLGRVGDALLANLSLLFIPAAVGIVQYLQLLREKAVPIAVTIAVSTTLALAVTALTFCAVARLHAFRRKPLTEDVERGADVDAAPRP